MGETAPSCSIHYFLTLPVVRDWDGATAPVHGEGYARGCDLRPPGLSKCEHLVSTL